MISLFRMREESPKMKAENPKRAPQVVGLRTKGSERYIIHVNVIFVSEIWR